MYFQKIGNGKTTVIFLHGWGCAGGIFLPVAERLHNFKCYLVDFDGFGKSPLPPQSGWSVLDYADDLLLFFKQHNITSANIVAHSFGCRVAIVFASNHPELVQKMLLVAPAGIRFFSLRRFMKVQNYKLRKHLHLNTDGSGSVDYNACAPEMRNTFVKIVNQDLSRYAESIKCPVLIVNGKTDLQTPMKQARKLRRLVKNSALVEIDGDHFAFFKSPAAFAQTITYFLGASS